jgi:hypothetical protein
LGLDRNNKVPKWFEAIILLRRYIKIKNGS